MLTPPAAPDASFAQLVLDDEGSEPRRFRTTRDLPGLSGGDEGEPTCSGSCQFSATAWRRLRALLDVPPELLYVVDLRQESHGFLNEAAVSWYARDNWGGAGLSEERSLALESIRLELLEHSDTLQLGRAEDIKSGTARTLMSWRKQRVSDEAHMLGLPEGHYVRLPVLDHTRPADTVVDRFLLLLRRLPPGAHLHVHCRGGKGRTSTFLALHDMLRHASHLSLAVILERQHRLNDYDLGKLPDPAKAKAPYIQERSRFLEAFHAYARSRETGTAVSWTQWLSTRPGP